MKKVIFQLSSASFLGLILTVNGMAQNKPTPTPPPKVPSKVVTTDKKDDKKDDKKKDDKKKGGG